MNFHSMCMESPALRTCPAGKASNRGPTVTGIMFIHFSRVSPCRGQPAIDQESYLPSPLDPRVLASSQASSKSFDSFLACCRSWNFRIPPCLVWKQSFAKVSYCCFHSPNTFPDNASMALT